MREDFFKKISNILNKKLLQGAKFFSGKKLQRRGKKFVMWAAAAAAAEEEAEAEGIKQSVAISESDQHDEWWLFAFARNQNCILVRVAWKRISVSIDRSDVTNALTSR